MANIQKITPFLWFNGNAEEATKFYVSIFKNSKITHISRYEEGSPMPAGTVMTTNFELEGQAFMALNGGPEFTFSEAVSFMVHCDDQIELDYYWEKLSDGGQTMACGWLKDKFGLAWQIVPTILSELMTGTDAPKTERVMQALWKMVKIDIAKLQEAASGEGKTNITVETIVQAPLEKIWRFWTQPEHIVHWNNASGDWHTPRAENDLRPGGSFSYRMEAKDGSFGFDFGGVYSQVVEYQRIVYTIEDGRKVQVHFTEAGNGIRIVENFEAESLNPVEVQQGGWQAILDNFKKYVEANG